MNLWTPPYSLLRKILPFCSFQKDEAAQINQKNENDRPNFIYVWQQFLVVFCKLLNLTLAIVF
jgi:hypothetical protein